MILYLILACQFYVDATPDIMSKRETVGHDRFLFASCDLKFCKTQVEWNVSHREQYSGEVISENSWVDYLLWDAEMCWRHDCWYYLGIAQTPNGQDNCNCFSRCHALEQLKKLLGNECFSVGWMPCPVPNYRRNWLP